jgi:hypothetical protein
MKLLVVAGFILRNQLRGAMYRHSISRVCSFQISLYISNFIEPMTLEIRPTAREYAGTDIARLNNSPCVYVKYSPIMAADALPPDAAAMALVFGVPNIGMLKVCHCD